MTGCLDTNVLIQARAHNPYGVILDGFVFGFLNWAFYDRVLPEYEEIICGKAGTAAWNQMVRLLALVPQFGL